MTDPRENVWYAVAYRGSPMAHTVRTTAEGVRALDIADGRDYRIVRVAVRVLPAYERTQ